MSYFFLGGGRPQTYEGDDLGLDRRGERNEVQVEREVKLHGRQQEDLQFIQDLPLARRKGVPRGEGAVRRKAEARGTLSAPRASFLTVCRPEGSRRSWWFAMYPSSDWQAWVGGCCRIARTEARGRGGRVMMGDATGADD